LRRVYRSPHQRLRQGRKYEGVTIFAGKAWGCRFFEDERCISPHWDKEVTMAQEGPPQERMERIAQALQPRFDAARFKLARQFAQAEEGRLIEQTEGLVFEELNRLKTSTQEVGLQQRIDEAEGAFSPSGPARKAARQRD